MRQSFSLRAGLVAALLATASLIGTSAQAVKPSDLRPERVELSCSNSTLPSTQGMTIPLCTSGSLTEPNPAIRRAIIVVSPGENRGGAIPAAVTQAGLEGETIVIAPSFPENGSTDPNTILYWDGLWRFGGPSSNGPAVSSFTIIDDIVKLLASSQNFPNLDKLVVTGFSAGGQFTNRYAATNPLQQQIELQTSHRIQFRYVIGSPSIYVYMDERRWNAASQSFLPLEDASCGADAYPWGLSSNQFSIDYISALTPGQIRGQYGLREVYYLLAGEDNQRDSALTIGCASDAQGLNRLERGQLYYKHISEFFAGGAPSHRMVVVPGIGHSDAVYISELGMPTLFDNWSRPTGFALAGRLEDGSGQPIAGALVDLGAGRTATTNASGNYLFAGLAGGSYTLGPSASDLRFSPPSRTIQLAQNTGGLDFVGAAIPRPKMALRFMDPSDPAFFAPGSAIYLEVTNFPPSTTADLLVNGQQIGAMPIDGQGKGQVALATSEQAALGPYFVTARSGEVMTSLNYALSVDGLNFYPTGIEITIPSSIPLAKQLFLPLNLR